MFGASRLGLFAANPIAGGVTGGYALFAGGYDNGTLDAGTRTAAIRKYDLSTDAVSTSSLTLNAAYDQVCAFANGTTGVLAGGSDGNSQGSVRLVNLSAESISNGQALTVNTLATRLGRGASSSTVGYLYGGWTTAPVNDIKKYTYSTNVWAYTTNGLGYTNALLTIGVHNNSTVAVLTGGYVNSTLAPSNIVKEFDFSTESTATASYTLSETRAQQSVTGNQTKYVSIGGFNTSGLALTTVVDTYLFSAGTRTAQTSLTHGFRMGDAAGDDQRGIYAGSETTGGGTYSTTTNWIYTYSTDTRANASNYLYTNTIDIPGALHSLQTS